MKVWQPVRRWLIPQRYVPYDLFILTLTWLDLQALVVHLMHISRRLHVAQNVIL